MKNKKENNNNIFIIVLFTIILVLVLFMPKIYSFIENKKLPEIENTENNNKEEEKIVDEEMLESLHFPVMRNSVYDSNTYYNLDTFSINNMSNNDILYNAFLDIYEGNMTPSNTNGNCTNISKQFNKDYMELRIKNILGKNINYTLDSFYVPEDSASNYKGTWTYDSNNQRFLYQGLCESKISNIKYYNLEELIKAEYEGNDIIVYYYVGFAKVVDNNYTIYKDANMSQEISSGNLNSADELQSLFEKIDKNSKNIYRYTFKNTLCSYNEYCLYEGKWTNEL